MLLGDLYAEYADAGRRDARGRAAGGGAHAGAEGREGPRQSDRRTARPTAPAPAVKIERITLPNQEADGTQCYVHFPKVDGAKQYDVWARPYADGRGALHLGKAWKEPGRLVRGLRPNQNFYLFVTYTDADGKVSKPSPPFKINLEDFFGMK